MQGNHQALAFDAFPLKVSTSAGLKYFLLHSIIQLLFRSSHNDIPPKVPELYIFIELENSIFTDPVEFVQLGLETSLLSISITLNTFSRLKSYEVEHPISSSKTILTIPVGRLSNNILLLI